MARDYLAIPCSSVSSEQAFSSSSHTDQLTCNFLEDDTFKNLQITKDTYKTGILDGGLEAFEWKPKKWIVD
ncbi:hypothetical protein AN958_09808 [Leucoagaricus sp. SymC.cos]|nr:hypothetical protein AN958_09808 [Leucoagaricus sp. SymC.cos]